MDDDEALLNSSKYRSLRYECEAALQAFDKAEEWPDLIKYLQRLHKIFQKSPEPLVVPHKVLIAKRLAQCLHAGLPAGVHLKTLEMYQLIFEKLSRERLAKDIAFYSEGLFPLCRHASYEVKPFLLDLLERHYTPLGLALTPCMSGLVLCLLTALGDTASESHARVMQLLDRVREATSTECLMTSLWTCLLLNPEVRMQALAYAHARFPAAAEPEDGAQQPAARRAPALTLEAFMPPHIRDTLVLRSLLAALADEDSLVQRTTLELLLAHLPLRGAAQQVFGGRALRTLLVGALTVLPMREWALTRRVFQWLTAVRADLGVDPAARAAPTLEGPVTLIFGDALRELFSSAHSAAARVLGAEGSADDDVEGVRAGGGGASGDGGQLPPPVDGGGGGGGGGGALSGGGADAARAAALSDTIHRPILTLIAALEDPVLCASVREDTRLIAVALAWACRWQLGVTPMAPLLAQLGESPLWRAVEGLADALCDADVSQLAADSHVEMPPRAHALPPGGAPPGGAGPLALAPLAAAPSRRVHGPRPSRAAAQMLLISSALELVVPSCAERARARLPVLVHNLARRMVTRAIAARAFAIVRRALALITELHVCYQRLELNDSDGGGGGGGECDDAQASASGEGGAAAPAAADGADGRSAPPPLRTPSAEAERAVVLWPPAVAAAVSDTYCGLSGRLLLDSAADGARAPRGAELATLGAASRLLESLVLGTVLQPVAPLPPTDAVCYDADTARAPLPLSPTLAASAPGDSRGPTEQPHGPGAADEAAAVAPSLLADMTAVDLSRGLGAVGAAAPPMRWAEVEDEGGGGGGGGGGEEGGAETPARAAPRVLALGTLSAQEGTPRRVEDRLFDDEADLARNLGVDLAAIDSAAGERPSPNADVQAGLATPLAAPGAAEADEGGLGVGGLARWYRRRWSTTPERGTPGAGARGPLGTLPDGGAAAAAHGGVGAHGGVADAAAPPAAGSALVPTRADGPAWLEALLRGCTCVCFEIASVCIETLIRLYSAPPARGGGAAGGGGGAGLDLAAISAAARGGEALPQLRPPDIVAVLSTLWGFLGSENADTQLAAASLWRQLQLLWPRAAARVLERALRAASPPPLRFASAAATPGGLHAARPAGTARAANLRRFAALWRIDAVDVRADAPMAVAGRAAESSVTAALLLALDCVEDPTPVVRATAFYWLSDALRTPHRLTEPLLLLAHTAPRRPRQALYALTKLCVLLGAGHRSVGARLGGARVHPLLSASFEEAAGALAGSPAQASERALGSTVAARSHLEMCICTGLLLLSTLGHAPRDRGSGGGAPPGAPPPGLASELHAASTQLLLTALRVAPNPLSLELAAACTRPLLRALGKALRSGADGQALQAQLLLLLQRCVRAHAHAHAHAAASGAHASVELPSDFVPCLSAGLRDPLGVAWPQWVWLSLSTMPFAGDTLATVVVTSITTLCELPQRCTLSSTALCTALIALHDIVFFAIFGRLATRSDVVSGAGGALALGAVGTGGGGGGGTPGTPRAGRARSTSVASTSGAAFGAAAAAGGAAGGAEPSAAVSAAAADAVGPEGAGGAFVSREQAALVLQAVFQQAPTMVSSVLHVCSALGGAAAAPGAAAEPAAEARAARASARPLPAAVRAVALRPLALLAVNCRKEFLAAVMFVWERSSSAEEARALLALLGELPRTQPRDLLPVITEALVGAHAATRRGGSRHPTLLAAASAAQGAQVRVPEAVALRFVHAYVGQTEPVSQLHMAWPQLVALIKAALAGGGVSVAGAVAPGGAGGGPGVPALPALLTAIGFTALRRIGAGAGPGLELRAREVREAQELVEQLLHAGLSELRAPSVAARAASALSGGARPSSAALGAHGAAAAEAEASLWGVGQCLRDACEAARAARAPKPGADEESGTPSSPAGGGAGAGSAPADGGGIEVGAEAASEMEWAASMADASSLLLCTLSSLLLPLLRLVFTAPHSRRSDGVTDVVAELLPLIILPLEQQPSQTGPTRHRPRVALRLVCAIIEDRSTVKAWRRPIARLFASARFFEMSSGMLPLWARVVNTLSNLETPKAAVTALLSGRDAEALSLFAGKAAEASAAALLLKRLAFFLYSGEVNQYVGALQGVIFAKLVSSLKEGGQHAHVVQAEALLCIRLIAVRVTPVHLQALWPIALAELKRVLANPAQVPPSLVLAAFLLLDMILAVLPNEFGYHAWMFLLPSPNPTSLPPAPGAAVAAPAARTPPPAGPAGPAAACAPPAAEATGAAGAEPASQPAAGAEPAAAPAALPAAVEPNGHADGGTQPPALPALTAHAGAPAAAGLSGAALAASFQPYLAKLAARVAPGSQAAAGAAGLLARTAPSPMGRRRPLLALSRIHDVSELAPYALALGAHMHENDTGALGTEVDSAFIDALLGCHFLARPAAEQRLATLRAPASGAGRARSSGPRAQGATPLQRAGGPATNAAADAAGTATAGPGIAAAALHQATAGSSAAGSAGVLAEDALLPLG